MRKNLIPAISICFTFSFCFQNKSVAQSQSSESDTVFYKKAITSTVLLYHEQMGNQRGVFNGVSYYGYAFPFEQGHPYFNSSNPEPGSIIYDHIFYPAVLLSYDEVADVVVLHQSNRSIQLHSNNISRFEILTHKFIHFPDDVLVQSAIKPGFYELLYEGKVRLLKKETKKISDYIRTKGEGVLKNVEIETKYYIQKNNYIYAVKNMQSVFQIYNDKRDKIDHFLQTKQLSYKKDRDRMLMEVTAFYDQTTE
ncbi:MAG: hypothetical protein ABL872_00480 [Lacibacter sp.]